MMIDNFIGTAINNVKIEKQIFKGSNKVFIGIDEKTNERLVVKAIDIRGGDDSVQKSIGAERKIGLNLSKKCVFLVKLREIVYRPDFIYILMEFCENGDLTTLIGERVKQNKPFSDDDVAEMAFQLGRGLETLHIADVVHRDLKPDNIFLKKDEKNIFLKIGDFGISRIINSNQKNTTLAMGTIGYTPPEILNGEGGYNKAGDVYTLGVIFVEFVDLKHPFTNEKNLIQQGRIFTGQANPARANLSPFQKTFRDFALKMMDLNPANRPTISAVLAFPPFAAFLGRSYEALKERVLAQDVEIEQLRKQLGAGGNTPSPSIKPTAPPATTKQTQPVTVASVVVDKKPAVFAAAAATSGGGAQTDGQPYRVLYDFKGGTPNELTIKQDEMVYVQNEDDARTSGWAMCKKPYKVELGYVPFNYLQPLLETTESVFKIPAGMKRGKALYAYTAKAGNSEITVNEIIAYIPDSSHSGWVFIQRKSGATGYVPTNYIGPA